MWRFECIDSAKVEGHQPCDDVIRIPIKGSKLSAKHYFDTPVIEPELGKFCATRITIS